MGPLMSTKYNSLFEPSVSGSPWETDSQMLVELAMGGDGGEENKQTKTLYACSASLYSFYKYLNTGMGDRLAI